MTSKEIKKNQEVHSDFFLILPANQFQRPKKHTARFTPPRAPLLSTIHVLVTLSIVIGRAAHHSSPHTESAGRPAMGDGFTDIFSAKEQPAICWEMDGTGDGHIK